MTYKELLENTYSLGLSKKVQDKAKSKDTIDTVKVIRFSEIIEDFIKIKNKYSKFRWPKIEIKHGEWLLVGDPTHTLIDTLSIDIRNKKIVSHIRIRNSSDTPILSDFDVFKKGFGCSETRYEKESYNYSYDNDVFREIISYRSRTYEDFLHSIENIIILLSYNDEFKNDDAVEEIGITKYDIIYQEFEPYSKDDLIKANKGN